MTTDELRHKIATIQTALDELLKSIEPEEVNDPIIHNRWYKTNYIKTQKAGDFIKDAFIFNPKVGHNNIGFNMGDTWSEKYSLYQEEIPHMELIDDNNNSELKSLIAKECERRFPAGTVISKPGFNEGFTDKNQNRSTGIIRFWDYTLTVASNCYGFGNLFENGQWAETVKEKTSEEWMKEWESNDVFESLPKFIERNNLQITPKPVKD